MEFSRGALAAERLREMYIVRLGRTACGVGGMYKAAASETHCRASVRLAG